LRLGDLGVEYGIEEWTCEREQTQVEQKADLRKRKEEWLKGIME